eukprot:3188727-Prymnesium_polylepis.1
MIQASIESLVALFYLFAIPYQIGFQTQTEVEFNRLYALSYALDCVLLLVISSKLVRASSRRFPPERASWRSPVQPTPTQCCHCCSHIDEPAAPSFCAR